MKSEKPTLKDIQTLLFKVLCKTIKNNRHAKSNKGMHDTLRFRLGIELGDNEPYRVFAWSI